MKVAVLANNSNVDAGGNKAPAYYLPLQVHQYNPTSSNRAGYANNYSSNSFPSRRRRIDKLTLSEVRAFQQQQQQRQLSPHRGSTRKSVSFDCISTAHSSSPVERFKFYISNNNNNNSCATTMSERRISINLSGSDSSSSNNNNNDERRDGGGHPMLTARRLSINLSQVATHDIHNTSAFPDNACNDANGAAPATTEHSARRRSFNLSLNLGSHNSNDNDSMVEDATEYMAMNIYDPSFEENVLQHLITVDGSTTVAALSHKSKVMLVFFKDLEDDYCMQMLSDLQRCATLVAQLSTRIVLCYHDKAQLEETASKFEGLSNPTSRSSGFLLVHDPQYHNYARFGITPLSLRTLTPRFISNMIKAVEDRLRSDEIDVNILGSVFIIEKGVVLCQHIASNRSEKIDFMRVLIDPGMGESGHGSLPGSEEDIIDEMHQQLHLQQQQQQLQQQQDANNNNNNNGEMSLPELQLKTRKSAVEKIQRLISKSKTRRKATMNNNNNNNNKPATAMATPTTDPADTLTISSTPSACGSTTPRGDNMSTSTSTPRSTSSANSDDQDSQIIELQETLHDARKRRFFKLHASREFSMENILFWEAVELYRAKHRVLSSEERRAIAAAIIDRYFTKDSPWELNTESRLVHEVNEKLENSMLQYHREEQQQVHLKEPGPMVGTSAQPILLSTTYEKRQLKIPSLLPSRKGSVMKLTTYSSSSSSTSSENNSNSNSSNSNNNNNNSSSGIINSNNFPPEDLFDSIRKDIEYGPLLDTYMRFRKTELFREMLFAVAEKSGRVRSAGGRAMSLGQTPRSLRSSSSSSNNNSSSSSRKSMSSLFGHGGYSATTKRHSQG